MNAPAEGARLARPPYDAALTDIADYVQAALAPSAEALANAHWSLLDALGCGLESLDYPACTKLLGPIVPGTIVPAGARVPGTSWELDPVTAAFSLGTMVRWLDYNDTWLAAEWGHPSDNVGGILAVADWLSRNESVALTMRDVLVAMIKAYEIQGVLALDNAFNRVGLDHVLLVKVATTAVVAQMLGLPREQVVAALSLAFVDGQALRTYRHAPNTGSRKSWAAGDATARGVRLALFARTGEMGCPSALSAPLWGFCDASLRGAPLRRTQPYGQYVMENILYKVSFPAEFHAQTAVECALALHPQVRHRLGDIAQITVRTQQSALRIIAKDGPLSNPADRDHCLQYMIAVPLLHGRLTAADYEDAVAADPRVDALRAKMVCVEDAVFSRDYLDPAKRSIANGVTIEFMDGSRLPEVVVEYPVGHRRRRDEARPLLAGKFQRNIERRFDGVRRDALVALAADSARLAAMPVREFVDMMVIAP